MYNALIVDDEDIIRRGLQVIIPWSEIGIDNVLTANSGEEALEIIQANRIDFMITDICMLNMSGLELIEKINKFQKKIRIVVLTGYDNFEYLRNAAKWKCMIFC